MAQRENVAPTSRAACANSFVALEYLKRVMRMKPNPKPVEVQVGGIGSLIDYKALVRRPKALIDVSEPKPPGPRTEMASSDYYKAKLAEQAPEKPAEDPPAG